MAITSRPSGFSLLLTRINANCTEPLAPGQIAFASPASAAEDNSDTNTTIAMSATDTSPYEGSVTFTYGRLDLQTAIDLNAVSTAGITAWRTMGLSDFLGQVNKRCGTTFGTDDISSTFDLSNASVDQATVSITAATSSITLRGTSDVSIDLIPEEELTTAVSDFHTFVFTTLPSLHLAIG